MGLLADIFSYGDGLKRKVNGLLQDPAGTVNLGATRMAEDQNSLLALMDQAGYTPGSKSVLQTQQGQQQARNSLAEKAMQTYGGLLGATVWHGSPHKFDKFDLNAQRTTGGNFNKYGVSVSEQPSVAQRYADDFGGPNGSIYKVESSTAKPMDLSAGEFHKLQALTGAVDHAKKTGRSLAESQSIDLEMLMKKHGIAWREGDHPIDAIKRAGYDSIRGAGFPSRSGLAEQESLIFDPSLLQILERNGQPIK